MAGRRQVVHELPSRVNSELRRQKWGRIWPASAKASAITLSAEHARASASSRVAATRTTGAGWLSPGA